MKSAAASRTLAQLRELTEAHQVLTDAVRMALPEPLQDHLQGVALEGDRLILLSDTASWGARLRYMERELIDAVRRHWPHLQLRRISVRVISLPQPQRWQRRATPPDGGIIDQMAETADSLRHERVRERLKRLSEKLRIR